MNSIAASASTQPATGRRFVVPALLAILSIVAVIGGANSIVNPTGPQFLVWTLSMVALACFWVRIAIPERAFPKASADFSFRL